jgi:serine/threonine protein kinase
MFQTVARGVDDAIQRQFATMSLKSIKNEYRSSAHVSSYGWAVSSLEILLEGEVLGCGAFGTVFAGRWNGTKVAVKQLARGTPREVGPLVLYRNHNILTIIQMLIHEIDIWRRLQHPHIASFFRACIESNPPLLVSELYTFGNAMNYLFKYPDTNRVNMVELPHLSSSVVQLSNNFLVL